MATLSVTRRFDLTEARSAALEPEWPPKWSRWQLIDGIRWRAGVGSPSRDVPECYGPWQPVYGLFRRWQSAGVWQRVRAAAGAASGGVASLRGAIVRTDDLLSLGIRVDTR